MKFEEIEDLLTGEKFVPTRINQKFKTAANRIKFYNDMANDLRHDNAYINKAFHNNLKKLNHVMEKCYSATSSRDYLKGVGIDFLHLQTHTKVFKGKEVSMFYNYVVEYVEKDKIKITDLSFKDKAELPNKS